MTRRTAEMARTARAEAEFLEAADVLMVELESAKEALRQARERRDNDALSKALAWYRDAATAVHQFRRWARETARMGGEG